MRRLTSLIFLLLSIPAFAQGHKVSLSWNAPDWTKCNCSNGGYNVYREQLALGSYTKIASNVGDPRVGAALTAYDDTTVTSGLSYNYYVTSVDTVGDESSPSNTVTLTIPSLLLNPVGGVTIHVAMNGRVSMHFDDQCTEYDTALNVL